MALETCPNCGADIPPRARACPECGSDERTGWSDAADLDRLGIPSEEFDHARWMRDEFGRGSRRLWWQRRGLVWGIVAILTLLAVLALLWRSQ